MSENLKFFVKFFPKKKTPGRCSTGGLKLGFRGLVKDSCGRSVYHFIFQLTDWKVLSYVIKDRVLMPYAVNGIVL